MTPSRNVFYVLAALVGIASGFRNKEPKTFGTTYYAISDGHGGFFWGKFRPEYYVCQVSPNGGCCTIITFDGYVPQNNVTPYYWQALCLKSNSIYGPP
jgi:hypothetical protein